MLNPITAIEISQLATKSVSKKLTVAAEVRLRHGNNYQIAILGSKVENQL